MGKPRILETNVPGPFYVNSACIDCDTCRQLAPEVYAEVSGYSAVVKQPEGEKEKRRAIHALLACPTAAIGSKEKEGTAQAIEDFPLPVAENIYYCGFTSSKSYGGSSYLIKRSEGNWLIDSPRFVPGLERRFTEMGGIHTIFLTHRDDVADAEHYAEKFQAERIIHVNEKSAQPGAGHIIEGREVVEWEPEFKIIMTPGHTRGHMVLLYKNRFLFTGDHLAWNREQSSLEAYRDHCWFSWQEQTESMKRLAEETFEWVLPGHGQRVQLEKETMKRMLARLIEEMQQ